MRAARKQSCFVFFREDAAFNPKLATGECERDLRESSKRTRVDKSAITTRDAIFEKGNTRTLLCSAREQIVTHHDQASVIEIEARELSWVGPWLLHAFQSTSVLRYCELTDPEEIDTKWYAQGWLNLKDIDPIKSRGTFSEMRLLMNLLLLFSFSIASATGSIGSPAFAELSACAPLSEVSDFQFSQLPQSFSTKPSADFLFLEKANAFSVQAMELSEAPDHDSSDACPTDCHCPAHFACSGHFTMLPLRSYHASTGSSEDAAKYPRLNTRVSPSPYLEGPFQPPKV
jgi:hypothetical protein